MDHNIITTDAANTKEQTKLLFPLPSALAQLRQKTPRIHCLTNIVTMNAVANALLAIGASAIMGQAPEEIADISAICQGTLINTGTPDSQKFISCTLAARTASHLSHPVVLDPVGVGASSFRKKELKKLLGEITPTLIRCNLEEAVILLKFASAAPAISAPSSGGVESGIQAAAKERLLIAGELAAALHTTILLSGPVDAVASETQRCIVSGGSSRMMRMTGSGCILSALGAAFLAAGLSPFEGALAASRVWKHAAAQAEQRAIHDKTGIGFFPQYLLCELETMIGDEKEGGEKIELYTG